MGWLMREPQAEPCASQGAERRQLGGACPVITRMLAAERSPEEDILRSLLLDLGG